MYLNSEMLICTF